MKEINTKMPIYKQVPILSQNFKELGIKFVYNSRTKEVYLSLFNAPTFAEGVAEVQQTLMSVYPCFGYVRDNFEYLANRYKQGYKEFYSGNSLMLKYLD